MRTIMICDVGVQNEGLKTLSIKLRNRISNIQIDAIRYAESNKRRVYIYTESGMVYCYGSLNDLEAQLPDYFLRCHKSFLVNMKKIERFNGNDLCLYTGEEIRVSRNKKVEARNKYMTYLQEENP